MTEESTAVRVRDIPWDEMRDLLRRIGPEIATLATRGDQFAQKIMARYHYAFAHPADAKANQELRCAIEDYVNRDLRLGELFDLGSRFGHRLPEPEKGTGVRVFMPTVDLKQ